MGINEKKIEFETTGIVVHVKTTGGLYRLVPIIDGVVMVSEGQVTVIKGDDWPALKQAIETVLEKK